MRVDVVEARKVVTQVLALLWKMDWDENKFFHECEAISKDLLLVLVQALVAEFRNHTDAIGLDYAWNKAMYQVFLDKALFKCFLLGTKKQSLTLH